MSQFLYAEATVDPASLTTGISSGDTIAVVGAAMGDFVQVSFSLDMIDVTVTGAVTAADVVTVLWANVTAGTLNLGSGTMYVRVEKRLSVVTP